MIDGIALRPTGPAEASGVTHHREGGSESLEAQSRGCLIDIFTTLRAELAEQIRKGAVTDAAKADRNLAIYDALLAGLTGREALPDGKDMRECVAELARATDEANGYEQAALEHRAFRELVGAIGSGGR